MQTGRFDFGERGNLHGSRAEMSPKEQGGVSIRHVSKDLCYGSRTAKHHGNLFARPLASCLLLRFRAEAQTPNLWGPLVPRYCCVNSPGHQPNVKPLISKFLAQSSDQNRKRTHTKGGSLLCCWTPSADLYMSQRPKALLTLPGSGACGGFSCFCAPIKALKHP